MAATGTAAADKAAARLLGQVFGVKALQLQPLIDWCRDVDPLANLDRIAGPNFAVTDPDFLDLAAELSLLTFMVGSYTGEGRYDGWLSPSTTPDGPTDYQLSIGHGPRPGAIAFAYYPAAYLHPAEPLTGNALAVHVLTVIADQYREL